MYCGIRNLVVAIGLPPDGEVERTQRLVDDVDGFTQTINAPLLQNWPEPVHTGAGFQAIKLGECGSKRVVLWLGGKLGCRWSKSSVFFPNRQRLLLVVGQPSIGIPPSDPNAFRADRNGTQQAAGVIPHPTSCHQEPALPT